MPQKKPNVVRLTPAGRGAIASLLVEGDGATALVDAIFRANGGRRLADVPPGRILFGHCMATDGTGEELVVSRRETDAVELHCHGGSMGVASVEQVLVEHGAEPLAWEDWLADHHQDPIIATAHLALAQARTTRCAKILLDQFNGALRRAIDAVCDAINRQESPEAGRLLQEILRHESVGLHLTRPWKVVLAGPPNAGKSSLINALVGYQRAIIDPTPGTTRDLVTATTAIDGWPVELIDTAGLHEGSHPVEKAGIARARAAMDEADLVLAVFDATNAWHASYDTFPHPASCPTLLVHSKCDLVKEPSETRPAGIRTSATEGTGIEDILATVAAKLVPEPIPQGAAVPFLPSQVEALRRAESMLRQADPAAAQCELAKLGTG